MKKDLGSYTAFIAFSSFKIFFLLASALGLFFFFSRTKHSFKNHKEVLIVTAHNEHIQKEAARFLEKRFKEVYGEKLKVRFIKYGGQKTNVKILEAIFDQQNDRTCKHDMLWGGGEVTFQRMKDKGYLLPIELSSYLVKRLPEKLLGAPVIGSETPRYWVATFLSTFGILCNKKRAEQEGLTLPCDSVDLAKPIYFNKILLGDPEKSSSIFSFYAIIFLRYPFDKAWSIFVQMAANSIDFVDNSSSILTNLLQGNALFAPCLTFFSHNIIDKVGRQELQLVIPAPENNFVNADPIGILKGAPNAAIAQFCINELLSLSFQSLMVLKKGVEGGPKTYTFGRIGVHPEVYEKSAIADRAAALNPFTTKTQRILDLKKSKKYYHVLSNLFKSCLIRNHVLLKKAWELLIKQGLPENDLHYLCAPPISEEEIDKILRDQRWEDPLFREKIKIHWYKEARKRYKKIIKKYSS